MIDTFDAPVAEYLLVLVALAVWIPVVVLLGWYGIVEIFSRWRR